MENKKQIWTEKSEAHHDHTSEGFSSETLTKEIDSASVESVSTDTCTSTAEKYALSNSQDSTLTTGTSLQNAAVSEGPERCFDLISQAMTRELDCHSPSADDGEYCDGIKSAPPMLDSVKFTIAEPLDKVERPHGGVFRNSTTQPTKHKYSSRCQDKNRDSIFIPKLISINIEDFQEDPTPTSPALAGQYKHAIKLKKHKSPKLAKTPDSSCDEDFWLPEFRDGPKTVEKVAPKVVESAKTLTHCQWASRKKCMEKWHSEKDNFRFCVVDMRSLVDITPMCSCPICCYIQRATLLYQNKDQLDKFVIVDQGNRFTILEKSKPWHRTHITDCVNPKPLARRFPDIQTAHSTLANKAYSHKMVRPGTVIKDQKRMKNIDSWSSSPSEFFSRMQKKETLKSFCVKGSSATSVI